MPMFKYLCGDCGASREHFVQAGGSIEKSCPKCTSKNYIKQLSRFKVTVEYTDTRDHIENVINPGVNEVYAQIGKEATDEDANTLENIFGSDKVKDTIAEKDD